MEIVIGTICKRDEELFVVRGKFKRRCGKDAMWHYRLSRLNEMRQGGPIPESVFQKFFTAVGFNEKIAREENFVIRCYERLTLLRTSERGRRLPVVAGGENDTVRERLKTKVFKILPRSASDEMIDEAILAFFDNQW